MSAVTPVLDGEIARWRTDPCRFIERALRDPETGRSFVLFDAERRFLREAFRRGRDGRLLYPELVFSAPKKSGKTTLAAMAAIYAVVVLGGRHAEAVCVANDLEQAQGRVFAQVARIMEVQRGFQAVVTQSRVAFPQIGGKAITAIAHEYAGAAGGNEVLRVFDEAWAYTSERSRRLWDELVPVPTQQISARLVTTYAGFEGESKLLEDLLGRGLKGEQIAPDLYATPGRMLLFHTHDFIAPWQTEAWREQMRDTQRPSAYLRMVENRFAAGEESFVPIEWWDACVDPAARPVVTDPALPVWVGVDASVKRDSTAIVAVTWDRAAKRARLVWHRIFQPSRKDPLDFEATIEQTLLDLHKRFRVRAVRYDPYQMVRSAQALQRAGVRMVEFQQSVPNLTEASQNLYDLVKGRNLVAYADAEVRRAVQQAVALETSRGWRIAKEKTSAKIDVVVALAQAALAAVEGGGTPDPATIGPVMSDGLTRASPLGPMARPRFESGGSRYGGGATW